MVMHIEKNGFVLHIEDTRMEISNKYGVFKRMDVAIETKDITQEFAEKKLDDFIDQHRVMEKSNPRCIKRVAFDKKSKEYIQLQAILSEGKDYWTIQKFDSELVYMGEICSRYKQQYEVQEWLQTNFNIEKCFKADVYKNSKLGDCTNGGISSYTQELYIVSKQKGPFEPEDIRQCVYIEWNNISGELYISCKPVYFKKRWYMAGGNFLYTSDSRFREITKSKYPIPIHDRCERR